MKEPRPAPGRHLRAHRRGIPTVPEADVEAGIKRGTPFIVRGHPTVRRLESEYSLASLAMKLSGTTIEVAHRLRWIERSRRVDAGNYLRHISGSQYYWRHFLLDAFGLAPALPEPGGPGTLYFDYGWIGPKGCVQTFHQDNHDQLFVNHNLFAQIAGRKYVALASPDDSAFFRDRPLVDGSRRHSAASPWDEIIWEECGTLAEALLEPGDLLYTPPRYWHFMRSLSTSISISRWWFTNRLAGVLYAAAQQVEVDPISRQRKTRSSHWKSDLAEFGGWSTLDSFLSQKPLLQRLGFVLALTRFYGKGVLDAKE